MNLNYIVKIISNFSKKIWNYISLPVIGFFSLIWIIYRVIQKPSRINYPCVKTASPFAAQFLSFLGISGSTSAILKSKLRRRVTISVVVLVVFMVTGWMFMASTQPPVFTPDEAPNSPIGEARGINPGRVVWVHEPEAVSWNGRTGTWWDENNVDQELVKKMVSQSILDLTGELNEAEAWDSLFKHFNQKRGRGNEGYSPGEKIVIKLNLNNSDSLLWDRNTGLNSTPQMIIALLEQLVEVVGVEETDITLSDPSRIVGNPIYINTKGIFPGVHFEDRAGISGRKRAEPDLDTPIYYADPEIEESGEVYLPASFVEADYLINLALLKGHDLAGITLNSKNHFGSIWVESDQGEWNNGWSPSHLHRYITVEDWRDLPKREMGTYNSLVELMGHEHLDGKTVLFLIDALYAAPSQGGPQEKWRSEPFDNDWTASLFVSQDPVAIESVGLDLMRNEPTLSSNVVGNVDNYLHEAALAHNPPSESFYDPEGDGNHLFSLGVHEHWNNEEDRQYSRNLGKDKGIELIYRVFEE